MTRNLTKIEIKEKLEALGINGDGNVKILRARSQEVNVPVTETKWKVIIGYVGQLKGAAQIVCEQGFVDLYGKVPGGKALTMNGSKVINPLTGVASINKETSAISMLKRCDDFKNEQIQRCIFVAYSMYCSD